MELIWHNKVDFTCFRMRCIFFKMCIFYIVYRISSNKRRGVYIFHTQFDPTFIRGRRLFEAGVYFFRVRFYRFADFILGMSWLKMSTEMSLFEQFVYTFPA